MDGYIAWISNSKNSYLTATSDPMYLQNTICCFPLTSEILKNGYNHYLSIFFSNKKKGEILQEKTKKGKAKIA